MTEEQNKGTETKDTENRTEKSEKKKGAGCLWKKSLSLAGCKIHLFETYLAPLALLAGRIHIGNIFWKSGMTKWNKEGFGMLDSATQLFEWEYIPNWEKNAKDFHGFDLSWTVPAPETAAQMATYAELGFPILLILGLGGRIGAFGLFMMALTIELLVYPGTTEHYHWMALLAILFTVGPGKISIDHFIRKHLLEKKTG